MSPTQRRAVRILLLVLLGLRALPVVGLTRADEPPPNLIFVSCDNLGYGDVEPRGQVADPTPRTPPQAAQRRLPKKYYVSKRYSATKALFFQAAAADHHHLYAITSRAVAKYDRKTGFRLATSQGKAQHLNSGLFFDGKLLCAHSNYPGVPERSEIKQLDPVTMKLTTYHDFGDFGGSLTWVVRWGDTWLCNFARYKEVNHETFLVQFDDAWVEKRRWKYPAEVVDKWGNHSTSGGIWKDGRLWVTDHDHGRIDVLRIPDKGDTLSYETSIEVPFTGQGIATDPVSGGLIGINRVERKLVLAGSSPRSLVDGLPKRILPRADQLQLPVHHPARDKLGRASDSESISGRRWQTLLDMQAVMGDFPGEAKRCPLDVKVIQEDDCGTYIRRLISYQAETGGRVPAYLLIPKRVLAGGIKAPAVLCLHPTDNAIGHKVVVGLGGRVNRQYASELAERGFVTLSPSYPQLADYQPDLKALGWKSGTMKAIWDNVRGLDLLDELPFVEVGKYGAIGHSLGGHNAVYTAVFDDRIVATVSSCGLDSYPDYYDGDLSRWLPGQGWTQERYIPNLAKYHGRLDEIPFDFQEMISALAPRRVFIAAPLRDGNFRAASVDRIVNAARPVFELWKASDRLVVEHPDCDHDFPFEMREKAYALFERTLR